MLEQFGILNPWIYTLGALMIVLAPGPNTLCVLRTSIVDGRRAAFVGMLAVMIGDSMLILLACADRGRDLPRVARREGDLAGLPDAAEGCGRRGRGR